jgi:type I restriction enzyme M protein
MPANNNEIEKRLWDAADELRANSKLKSSEYSMPVLGLIFLRYADYKFAQAEKELHPQLSMKGVAEAGAEYATTRRRKIGKLDYQARGVLYLPREARFENLIRLPEGANIGKAINDAMRLVETENEDLKEILPKTFNRLDNSVLVSLLKSLNSVPMDIEGDAFGKIYEYFLGKFAMSEGQKGGEFFTPTSLVRLIVEIIEPYHGRIYDPACGSGGMFVQSAEFVKRHRRSPEAEISIFGQERVAETVRLCKMNLAVHGLAGDIRQSNSYYEDPHNSSGRFDFVMANPPFNVDRVDKERIKDDVRRFPLGMPRADNGNYLWIQLFYSSLNESGRAGFVMANSAADARQSELEIRKQLIQAGVVDVMVAISSNFFYTVTLPCTLWFLDKGKRGGAREDQVLFIDARSIYTQIDRAHREFSPAQVDFLAGIARLYRGEDLNGYVFEPDGLGLVPSQIEILQAAFEIHTFTDVPGLCKVVSRAEIELQGWSLSPGRYVGVVDHCTENVDFLERLMELNDELEILNAEARELETQITNNISILLKHL